MHFGRAFLRGLRAVSVAILAVGAANSALAAQCTLGVMLDLPVTMEGLRASVPTKVNGKDTRFWLDSGVFFSIMPKAKAIEFSLPLEPLPPGFYITGIGGTASVELATIKSFGIVGHDIKNVRFLVGGTDSGNGLIGRNLLGIADTEVDLANGSVKLIKPHNCGNGALAYWTGGKPWFTVPLIAGSNPNDHEFRLPVLINGAKIEAVFDTGAPTSLLSRHAAERAGINLSGPGVVASSGLTGFGRRTEKGWIAPVASVAIGDEEILRTKIEVIDDAIAGDNSVEMLLGADYILAHHIYVARDQRRIYFTYSGGRPFLTEKSSDGPAKSAPVDLPAGKTRVEAVANAMATPKTDADYARRGNARLAAHQYADAIADLNEAIRLAPKNATYYASRARAYVASGDNGRSGEDLDTALKLDPANGEFLQMRAYMRLERKDKAGALADAEAAAKVTAPASLAAAGLAFLFDDLDQPARAIPLFDAVIAAHREDNKLGSLLNGRCWMRALANVDLDKALDDCNRAIKRDGMQAAYLDSRGLVHFRMGDFKAAIADYDSALKLEPDLAWSLYMRGLAKDALGPASAGKADRTAATALQADVADRAVEYHIGG